MRQSGEALGGEGLLQRRMLLARDHDETLLKERLHLDVFGHRRQGPYRKIDVRRRKSCATFDRDVALMQRSTDDASSRTRRDHMMVTIRTRHAVPVQSALAFLARSAFHSADGICRAKTEADCLRRTDLGLHVKTKRRLGGRLSLFSMLLPDELRLRWHKN